MNKITASLDENLNYVKDKLGYGVSFDVLVREFSSGGRRMALVMIDGFIKDDITLYIMRDLMSAEREDVAPDPIGRLVAHRIPYFETSTSDDMEEAITSVLSGTAALFIDGEAEAIIIDVRTYPARSPEEPDIERVTRGARDGFVETIVSNTALIRRRVRDPALRVELVQVGKRSRTDVAIIYIRDIANPDLVERVRERIKSINTDGIPMAEKSLEEFITGRGYELFPMTRYTERPDVAAVHLYEGHVIVVVDTSPSALILPTTIFHHVQHAEEFRQNALVGMYLRWIRFFGIFVTVVVPPVWLGLAIKPEALPHWLAFLGPKEPGPIPLFVQVLLAEFGIDLIRMASIHTPNAIATSLGIIGALLLGEMAVTVGILTPEVIIYVAVATIGVFATPSLEFGLSLRIVRLLLVVATGLFRWYGLAGMAATVLVYLGTRNSFGVPYLWPLVPLDARALLSALVRLPVPVKTARPRAFHLRDQDAGSAPGVSREDRETRGKG